jgi:hypothetical protein
LRRTINALQRWHRKRQAKKACDRARCDRWEEVEDLIKESNPHTVDMLIDYYVGGKKRVCGGQALYYFSLMSDAYPAEVRQRTQRKLIKILKCRLAPMSWRIENDWWIKPWKLDPRSNTPGKVRYQHNLDSRLDVTLKLMERAPELHDELEQLVHSHYNEWERGAFHELKPLYRQG